MGLNVNGTVLPIEEMHFAFLMHKLRNEYGFIQSSKNNTPCTKDGRVIPLYTYPCFEYLNSINWKDAEVFEYGLGYSTVWWTESMDAKVAGVEHDEKWFNSVKSVNPNLCVTHAEEKDKYVSSCEGEYDVIVIDGEHRAACAEHAIKHIKEDGMIILDNTDIYDTAKNILDASDLIPIHFHGFKPIHVESETTSCYLGRKFSRKPKSIVPMGGTKREKK